MSQGNMEIVRRLYEAVGRHDIEAVLSAYDPNVEYDFAGSPLVNLIGATRYHGHDGIRRMNRERYEAWEWIEDDLRELVPIGEQVVTSVASQGCGRASGIEVELTHYALWTFRAGKIARVAWFGTREEALEAAGLRE